MDFFTVPTITMRVLFVFIVLEHGRREVLHFNVTEHQTAAWTRSRSGRHSLTGSRPNMLFEIGTAFMAASSGSASPHSGSKKSSPLRRVPGKIHMPSA